MACGQRVVFARQAIGVRRDSNAEGLVLACVVAHGGHGEQRLAREHARANVRLRFLWRRRIGSAIVAAVIGCRRRQRNMRTGVLIDDLHEHAGKRAATGARNDPLDAVTAVTGASRCVRRRAACGRVRSRMRRLRARGGLMVNRNVRRGMRGEGCVPMVQFDHMEGRRKNVRGSRLRNLHVSALAQRAVIHLVAGPEVWQPRREVLRAKRTSVRNSTAGILAGAPPFTR